MRRAWGWWLAGYVVLLVALGWGLKAARDWTLRELSTPAAQSRWRDWKQAESQRQTASGQPVKRRIPKSDEPPALILMRDSFLAIVVTCGAIATFLYGFLAVLLRGSLRTSQRREADR